MGQTMKSAITSRCAMSILLRKLSPPGCSGIQGRRVECRARSMDEIHVTPELSPNERAEIR